MVDYDTLVASLRTSGFNVERVIEVPENAGESQMVIDGKLFTLSEVRLMLAQAEEHGGRAPNR